MELLIISIITVLLGENILLILFHFKDQLFKKQAEIEEISIDREPSVKKFVNSLK